MTTFNHLKFKPRRGDGVQARVFFANGYGASVVRGTGTYGAPSLREMIMNSLEISTLVAKGSLTVSQGGWTKTG